MAELTRCEWARKGDDAYVRYHDEEWGVPVRDDRLQFEFLTLESAQAGLSWAVVLKKRDGYRSAFADFDPQRVARFNQRKIEALVANPQIIRNRAKIQAAIGNAKAFVETAEEFGSFHEYLWRFVDGSPHINHWQSMSELPSSTPTSQAMSKDLRRRGFRFLGPVVCYAHMQAVGMVNDHLVSCFRHAAVQGISR